VLYLQQEYMIALGIPPCAVHLSRQMTTRPD
jgi:hypothetical protein